MRYPHSRTEDQNQIETDDFVEPVRDLLKDRKWRDYAMINLPRQKSLGRNEITNPHLAMISYLMRQRLGVVKGK